MVLKHKNISKGTLTVKKNNNKKTAVKLLAVFLTLKLL